MTLLSAHIWEPAIQGFLQARRHHDWTGFLKKDWHPAIQGVTAAFNLQELSPLQNHHPIHQSSLRVGLADEGSPEHSNSCCSFSSAYSLAERLGLSWPLGSTWTGLTDSALIAKPGCLQIQPDYRVGSSSQREVLDAAACFFTAEGGRTVSG